MGLQRFETGWKVLRQLGWRQAGAFALYQLQLRSGWLRARLPIETALPDGVIPARGLLAVPAPEALRAALGADGEAALLAEAEELLAGRVRLFGGGPRPLQLSVPQPLRHALMYGDRLGEQDIKFIWEAGRFGWAFVLARAYALTHDRRFQEAFWRLFEDFVRENPCNAGPYWTSAQEVALRLAALAFAGTVFAEAASAEQLARLAGSVQQHARRILPTMRYAEAQHNNHVLSEALGLFTAGVWLDEKGWQQRGWSWFEGALQTQIAEDGSYVQQSSNYHRLMLQEALWMDALGRQVGLSWSHVTRQRLAQAVRWLLAHMDENGLVINLGNNDGALVLPLAPGGAEDYRPVAQAAAATFLGQLAFADGAWNEALVWLQVALPEQRLSWPVNSVAVGRLSGVSSWATLRAVRFAARPAHADQLQVEMWWQGQNLVCDAGTYLYNGLPPWQNGLAGADVHNGVLVDGQQPMRRAGRFLWLDWDQAEWIERTQQRLVVERYGYDRLGVRHVRRLEWLGGDDWQVIDDLLPLGRSGEHVLTLHWLLADLPWQLREDTLIFEALAGQLRLTVRLEGAMQDATFCLVRAGMCLVGEGQSVERRGWVSRIYGERVPALSLSWQLHTNLPVRWVTKWQLKKVD